MSDEKPKDDPVAQLRRLSEALAEVDDDAVEPEPPREPLDARGKALADSIRKRVADAAARETLAKHEALRAAFRRAQGELARFPAEPVRPREEALPILKELLARAGEGAASIHFHKYDDATPEDLARIIGELRFLLAAGDRDDDK